MARNCLWCTDKWILWENWEFLAQQVSTDISEIPSARVALLSFILESILLTWDSRTGVNEKFICPFNFCSMARILECVLRATVRKYRPQVCKMKKSKIPKLCRNIGLGELFLEKILWVWLDFYFVWTATKSALRPPHQFSGVHTTH